MRGGAMFRKTSGAILCPSCGRLTNADAPVCLVCGRRNPGMWGFGGALGTLFRRWNFTNAVTAACVALYVISLISDPLAALRPRGFLEVFSPSAEALWALGDRKSTRLNSSHLVISYAVFCLKKKKSKVITDPPSEGIQIYHSIAHAV